MAAFDVVGEDPGDDGNPRAEIARLEDEIERFAAIIESCRKVILAAKVAFACGAVLFLLIALGIVRFDPMLFMTATVALLGGTVLYGSNRSTSDQATAKMKAAEALRAQLIGAIDLTVVSERRPIGRS